MFLSKYFNVVSDKFFSQKIGGEGSPAHALYISVVSQLPPVLSHKQQRHTTPQLNEVTGSPLQSSLTIFRRRDTINERESDDIERRSGLHIRMRRGSRRLHSRATGGWLIAFARRSVS